MTTKSDVVFQHALHFKEQVQEINIKNYEQDTYKQIIDSMFREIFKDYFAFAGKDSFVKEDDNVRGES